MTTFVRMSVDLEPHYKYYHYRPSLPAAVILAIVFGLSTVWHVVLITKHKTWYFIPLLIGGIFELVGYAARGVSNQQSPNPTLAPFVINTLLILIAPALLAASIYMILGRIIIAVDGEPLSLIKKKWLTKMFVTSDVVSFFIQLGGGGLMTSSHVSQATLGSHLILAGLVIQIILFGFFVVVAMVFHRRFRAMPTSQSLDPSLPWKKFMNVLYVTSTFIMIRSIVRVAEFVEGFEGEILTHEIFLYIFDAVPMAAVMYIFNIWYPHQFSVKPTKQTMTGQDQDQDSVEQDVQHESLELQSK